jgi:hypothetical protein
MPPQPMLKPLFHYPAVSIAYTGDIVNPILEKQIWTLEMLVERELKWKPIGF